MASIIDPVLAQALISEYQQQNSGPGGPALVTDQTQFLNGFYIDRQSLEDVLSNPDVVGVSVSLAKHPDFAGKAPNVFTLVFVGAETNPAQNSTPFINTGNMYSETPPCPPWCGGK